MPDDTYLTIKDISAKLQVSIDTVRRWVRSGQLPSVTFGGQYRIAPADLQEFIDKHRKTPSPKTP